MLVPSDVDSTHSVRAVQMENSDEYDPSGTSNVFGCSSPGWIGKETKGVAKTMATLLIFNRNP